MSNVYNEKCQEMTISALPCGASADISPWTYFSCLH